LTCPFLPRRGCEDNTELTYAKVNPSVFQSLIFAENFNRSLERNEPVKQSSDLDIFSIQFQPEPGTDDTDKHFSHTSFEI
jgi:hypothetical protein